MVAIVAFAVFGILFRTDLNVRRYRSVLSVLFASGFAALSTAIWLFTFLTSFLREPHTPPSLIFGVLLILLALAAIAYFVLSSAPTPSQTYSVIFGMGAALFLLVYAFYAYFDTTFALNSPIKLLDQVTALALMLFFLIETRYRLGGFSTAFLFPVGMIAFLLSASNGIGSLIYTATMGRPLVIHMMHDFLFLALSIYVLTRLISFILPSLFPEENAEASETVTTFEAEGAVVPTPIDPADPAQETFDFDNTAESAPEEAPAEIPAEATNAESTEEDAEEATEAALELDTPNEVGNDEKDPGH